MDYLPDMISTYLFFISKRRNNNNNADVFVSQHVPCLLIGLKSDLTVLRTVDPQLGHLIGNLFGVQAIESDNFTIHGIQLLQKYFIQFIYSDRKVLLLNQQQGMDHPATVTESITDDALLLTDHVSSSIKVNRYVSLPTPQKKN